MVGTSWNLIFFSKPFFLLINGVDINNMQLTFQKNNVWSIFTSNLKMCIKSVVNFFLPSYIYSFLWKRRTIYFLSLLRRDYMFWLKLIIFLFQKCFFLVEISTFVTRQEFACNMLQISPPCQAILVLIFLKKKYTTNMQYHSPFHIPNFQTSK